MKLEQAYPKLHQWVTFSGILAISHMDDGDIVVAVGDGGGIPGDGRFYGKSIDEALANAERSVAAWLVESKRVLGCLLAGDPAIEDQEFISVVGWPPEPNPHYKRGGGG